MATYSFSSGEKTTDAAIVNGKGLLCGIHVITDGTNDATVIVYDNTSAAGTKLFEAVVAGANDAQLFDFSVPVKAQIGIYVDVSGTGASYIVYFA